MIDSKKTLVIAQFSDCHLFSDKKAKHLGADVWQNLNKVLIDIALRNDINCAVFTGDLTQDHTEKSYQYFVEAVKKANITIPIYFLAGNHDDRTLLTHYLIPPLFQTKNTIDNEHWQIQLLDSKSDTPSGLVSKAHLLSLINKVDKTKNQLLMMHHHPINVGYYIDKHGLLEQQRFWQNINELNEAGLNIKAIASGHVHRATYKKQNNVDVYTCPATSVQFGDTKEKVASISPSYRIFYLESNGTIHSDIISP